MNPSRVFRFSGRIAPENRAHMLKARAVGDVILPPSYVNVPGVGEIPQYSPTVYGPFMGYNPAKDCGGNFMSYRFQPNNNCYAYGSCVASNSFPQPGRINSYLLPANFTGADVVTGATKDGLVNIGPNRNDLAKHRDAGGYKIGHYVALLISPPDTTYGWTGDYHWVRCDDSQGLSCWSQKDGGDQVTDFDFAGNRISDPATANWDVNQGTISSTDPSELIVSYDFYTYMFVPNGKVNIL